ncbi:phage virion morphogenesis protein [Azonexus sp.]|uniref:phage virion morphogenesis protein n=1 Tax=Azonexus sp. TaxID=1872668 RepID=UPI0039E3C15E
MITVDFDAAAIAQALGELERRVSPEGLKAPLTAIGELLAESTRQRFAAGTAPDGSRWAPNAESTYLGLLGKGDGRKKDGKVGARGVSKVMGKKPLVASGQLAGSIRHQLLPGGTGVEVGTNRFADAWDGGAAVHQFGSRDGRIPARPFLGLSDADETGVMAILNRHLAGALKK